MKIGRIKTGEWGKVKAFFDVTVGCLSIKGFKLVEGINGLFASMPSQQDKDGNYNDTVWADKETRSKLNELAISAYKKGDTPKRMVGGMSEIDRLHTSDNYADKDEGIPF